MEDDVVFLKEPWQNNLVALQTTEVIHSDHCKAKLIVQITCLVAGDDFVGFGI